MSNNKNKTRRRAIDRAGFTLIELMVSLSIFVVISAIGLSIIRIGFQATRITNEQEMAVSSATKAVTTMTREIRAAANSAMGGYPLSTLGGVDFMFYSDVDYDGETDRVRYLLDGNTLKRVVTPPGPSNDYSMPSATSTLAVYVNNLALEDIFSYYDGEYNVTADIDAIRLVKIFLKINVTPGVAPNDYIIETDVHFRNLKSNL